MKNGKKALLLAACAVLLVVATIFGTVAYLTSTDEVNNTFTVGNVQIKLDEAAVKPDGTYVVDHNNRVQENEYHLLPGQTYIKDPTVTVLADSEKSYVRMLVTINMKDELEAIFGGEKLDLTTIFGGYDATLWTPAGDKVVGNTRVYEFRYFAPVDTLDGKDLVLDDLFETITIPGSITNTQLATIDGLKIDVVAQAIQAAGFEGDANAAWAAFDVQYAPAA